MNYVPSIRNVVELLISEFSGSASYWLSSDLTKLSRSISFQIYLHKLNIFFFQENATKILGNEEKSKIEVFEDLDKSYSEEQKKKLNDDGFAFLTEKQMERLYGKESPYKHTKALKKFKRLRDDPEKYIEKE